VSQHFLQPFEPNKYTVMVGYDRPLDNFFGQVHVNEPGPEASDEPLLWVIGTTDLSDLRMRISEYAELPVPVAKELLAERRDRDNHPMHLIRDHRIATNDSTDIALASNILSEGPLDSRRLNTTLAALRTYQADADLSGGLSADEIDDFCEEINGKAFSTQIGIAPISKSLDGLGVEELSLETRRLSTVIAALDNYIEARGEVSGDVLDIETNGGTDLPLSDGEIGALSALVSSAARARGFAPLAPTDAASSKADTLSRLPVFGVPSATSIVMDRESMRSGVPVNMSVVGRSESGERVVGQVTIGSFVSVEREAFGDHSPELNESFSLSRVDGKDIAKPCARELTLER
jgi:hypothetical protein